MISRNGKGEKTLRGGGIHYCFKKKDEMTMHKSMRVSRQMFVLHNLDRRREKKKMMRNCFCAHSDGFEWCQNWRGLKAEKISSLVESHQRKQRRKKSFKKGSNQRCCSKNSSLVSRVRRRRNKSRMRSRSVRGLQHHYIFYVNAFCMILHGRRF